MAGMIGSVMGRIFGEQQPMQQQQQVMPGNIPATNANPAMASNPLVPEASIAATNEPVSPLDAHSELWKNDPNAKPKPVEPLFNIDPTKLAAAAANNDFLKAIPNELAEKIKAGGDDAVPAMLAAMNLMTQKNFGDSALATTKIVEDALNKQQARFEAMLPGLIGKQTLNDTLRKTNPIFDHPAAATMLKSLTEQVRTKFPTMPPDQQAAKANEYLLSFAEAANPKKATNSSDDKFDWGTFLEE